MWIKGWVGTTPKNENLCLLSTTRSLNAGYSIELQFHKEMKPSFATTQWQSVQSRACAEHLWNSLLLPLQFSFMQRSKKRTMNDDITHNMTRSIVTKKNINKPLAKIISPNKKTAYFILQAEQSFTSIHVLVML